MIVVTQTFFIFNYYPAQDEDLTLKRRQATTVLTLNQNQLDQLKLE